MSYDSCLFDSLSATFTDKHSGITGLGQEYAQKSGLQPTSYFYQFLCFYWKYAKNPCCGRNDFFLGKRKRIACFLFSVTDYQQCSCRDAAFRFYGELPRTAIRCQHWWFRLLNCISCQLDLI